MSQHQKSDNTVMIAYFMLEFYTVTQLSDYLPLLELVQRFDFCNSMDKTSLSRVRYWQKPVDNIIEAAVTSERCYIR